MQPEITPQEARLALDTIDRGRRRVIDEIDLPRWYWWGLALGLTVPRPGRAARLRAGRARRAAGALAGAAAGLGFLLVSVRLASCLTWPSRCWPARPYW